MVFTKQVFKNGRKYCSEREKNAAKKRWDTRGRMTIPIIKQKFASFGCILLATEYNDAREPLKFICACGKIAYKCWNKFQQGQTRCRTCGITKRSDAQKISIEKARKDFSAAGFVLLAETYVNCHTP